MVTCSFVVPLAPSASSTSAGESPGAVPLVDRTITVSVSPGWGSAGSKCICAASWGDPGESGAQVKGGAAPLPPVPLVEELPP